MKHFSSILPDALKKIGMKKKFNDEAVIIGWREIVGAEISSHTQPIKIYRGTMSVAAKNAVWAHHLVTLKEEIIAKINHYIGEKVVEDIRFLAGYFQNDQNNDLNEENTNPAEITGDVHLSQVVLSSGEEKSIQEISQLVTDEKLRQKITKILRKNAALSRIKKHNQWHECKNCRVLCPPKAEYCSNCNINHREKVKNEIRWLLIQAPWLTYKDCNKYIQCHFTDYNAVKFQLVDAIQNEIRLGKNEQDRIMTLVMMINNVKPEGITKEIVNNTLEKIRGNKNVSASRR